jgi:hypothetical protein
MLTKPKASGIIGYYTPRRRRQLQGLPNDHGPAHVHAFVGRAHAKILLATATDPPRLVRIVGRMKDGDIARAVAIVHETNALMREGWSRFHGQ